MEDLVHVESIKWTASVSIHELDIDKVAPNESLSGLDRET